MVIRQESAPKRGLASPAAARHGSSPGRASRRSPSAAARKGTTTTGVAGGKLERPGPLSGSVNVNDADNNREPEASQRERQEAWERRLRERDEAERRDQERTRRKQLLCDKRTLSQLVIQAKHAASAQQSKVNRIQRQLEKVEAEVDRLSARKIKEQERLEGILRQLVEEQKQLEEEYRNRLGEAGETRSQLVEARDHGEQELHLRLGEVADAEFKLQHIDQALLRLGDPAFWDRADEGSPDRSRGRRGTDTQRGGRKDVRDRSLPREPSQESSPTRGNITEMLNGDATDPSPSAPGWTVAGPDVQRVIPHGAAYPVHVGPGAPLHTAPYGSSSVPLPPPAGGSVVVHGFARPSLTAVRSSSGLFLPPGTGILAPPAQGAGAQRALPPRGPNGSPTLPAREVQGVQSGVMQVVSSDPLPIAGPAPASAALGGTSVASAATVSSGATSAPMARTNSRQALAQTPMGTPTAPPPTWVPSAPGVPLPGYVAGGMIRQGSNPVLPLSAVAAEKVAQGSWSGPFPQRVAAVPTMCVGSGALLVHAGGS